MAPTEELSASGHATVLEVIPSGFRCGNQLLTYGARDEALAYAYSRFKKEEILPLLYYEKPISMLDFIVRYLQPDSNTMLCWVEQGGTLNLAGMIWMNEVIRMGDDHTRANVGHGFFREYQRSGICRRFAEMAIEYGFAKLGLDVITGATPATNRAAVVFAKRLGFQVIGPLDGGTVWAGELCGVYLSSMTRSRWDTLSPWDGE